ncbi:MAG: phenylacetate-CoA oxygenase subunit PaaJ [Oligoflexia bacterium]|nr:phenylacetate-CoA oxygenase subunit PaaJ [Oligoflexia bacterium]
MTWTESDVLKALETVRDPEVPVLSVLDLGIIRGVDIQGKAVTVKVTPTYSGCPALELIERNVAEALRDKGMQDVTIERVLSPAWSTDWISEEGRRKLKEFGIAPPVGNADDELVLIGTKAAPNIPCPFCDSLATERRSQFGATACKALYYCQACHQPFEYFKPH